MNTKPLYTIIGILSAVCIALVTIVGTTRSLAGDYVGRGEYQQTITRLDRIEGKLDTLIAGR
tara:strand:+ start:4343 stop:4528 length:186 start_codon:yes stop_codon:yes gene_type:complete